MQQKRSIFLGFDPREAAAFAVARYSARRRMTQSIPILGLVLSELQAAGLYRRPLRHRPGPDGTSIMWDEISDAPMATQHACARFLVKELAGSGLVAFCDGDILVRGNMTRIFDDLEPGKALYCVKHPAQVMSETVKMDGQVQTPYARKLWSSVFVIDCDHPANAELTVDLINDLPGRDLHRFCWLKDDLIGSLGLQWNYLVGMSQPITQPNIVHFTLGTPDMPGYDNCEYSDEWRTELAAWASGTGG